MNYTDNYLDKCKEEALRLGLFDAVRFSELDNATIRANINGVGSAAMPEILRKAIDNIHPSMVLSSHIHDVDWSLWADGSHDYFLESNYHFEVNCKRTAKDMYSWYDPRRYIAYHRAEQYRKILDNFGGSAYVAAIEAREEEK